MYRIKLAVFVELGLLLTGAIGCGGGSSNGAAADMNVSGVALTCSDYCTMIQTNCTGDQQQYTDATTCIADCAVFPIGKSSDVSGNTLGCRMYHAGAARADPKTHCQHAGPGGAGMCGSNCDGICQLRAQVVRRAEPGL